MVAINYEINRSLHFEGKNGAEFTKYTQKWKKMVKI